MAKPTPRLLDVIGSKYLTPNMCRVTLGGAGLNRSSRQIKKALISN